ncbi:hypothetical protein BO70DRAFT_389351 [Aspergillus heteromorphus CBS 117.55]|uniref:Transcription factor domain-containing protein n=1 Tax=Aspergillus heteromorphus CBS 117.55 TaxID=1448321 RepID=A0A317VD27_9EURO|nr:uncharacterized protein BO70DRAFT_389351 [Aspergillus heteromorphus CBS 117.55]PWY72274.1 hypothetical protein BO70DRAFT_389351 [Aspergillus heteromorphus CBS 117.55]
MERSSAPSERSRQACEPCRLDALPSFLEKAPEFLTLSFLALTLSFSGHEFFHAGESDARESYIRSAEDTVWKMAAEGVPKIEVVQSLCLLALTHLRDRNEPKAWVAIGMASRLDSFRNMIQTPSYSSNDPTNSGRCYWSIRIIETILSPSLQLTTTWNRVTSYLHALRTSSTTPEPPWSPTSTYTTLTTTLHKFDSDVPDTHLLRNVSFTKRSAADLRLHHEYWHPWISMQFLSHGCAAIINHPFIHLVVLRSARGVAQSRLFLQQAVDQALFHSAWVFRLVCACEELEFPVCDPLVGHVVAATATVAWIFQFARDESISAKAKEQLAVFEGCLGRMARVWPHLEHKRHLLRSLQSVSVTTNAAKETRAQGSTIAFQPSLLWELLDPKLCSTAAMSADLTAQEEEGGVFPRPTGARMHVTTQFVHPLTEEQADEHDQPSFPGTPDGGGSAALVSGAEGLEQLSLDELFAQFAPDDFIWGE